MYETQLLWQAGWSDDFFKQVTCEQGSEGREWASRTSQAGNSKSRRPEVEVCECLWGTTSMLVALKTKWPGSRIDEASGPNSIGSFRPRQSFGFYREWYESWWEVWGRGETWLWLGLSLWLPCGELTAGAIRADAGRPVKRAATDAGGLGGDNGGRKVVRSGQMQDMFWRKDDRICWRTECRVQKNDSQDNSKDFSQSN